MRDTRRPALVVFAAVFVLGAAGLLVAAGIDDRRLAFTLGVQSTQVATVLQPGSTACQGPIAVPADARSVRFPVGTFGAPGPRLEVFTQTAGVAAARSSVAAGYADGATVSAAPGGIASGQRIELCVRNAGRRKVALHGGAPAAARTSILEVDGLDVGTDLSLVFERGEPRSMLSALGDAFGRAALFHPAWVSAGQLWVLAALLVTALPAALVLALRWALADPPPRAGEKPGLASD